MTIRFEFRHVRPAGRPGGEYEEIIAFVSSSRDNLSRDREIKLSAELRKHYDYLCGAVTSWRKNNYGHFACSAVVSAV